MAAKFQLKAQVQQQNTSATVARLLQSSPLLSNQTWHIEKLDPRLLTPHPKQAERWAADESYIDELAANISQVGVLQPLCVRLLPDGSYQTLAGHCRSRAAVKAGLSEVPCIVYDHCNDNAAEIIFDGTNLLQRGSKGIKPSELAAAYTEMEAAIAAGGDDALRPTARISELTGDNIRKIQRYKRLMDLIIPLRTMVDAGNLSIENGGQLSALTTSQQETVLACLETHGDHKISASQCKRLLEKLEKRCLNPESIAAALYPKRESKKKKELRVRYQDIAEFFPPDASEEEIITAIRAALLYYQERKADEIQYP